MASRRLPDPDPSGGPASTARTAWAGASRRAGSCRLSTRIVLRATPGLVLRSSLVAERVVLAQIATFGQLHAAELLPLDMLRRLLGQLRRELNWNHDRTVIVGN